MGKSDTKATINIDAVSGFAYEYTLEINGKSLKKYMENRSKVTSTWVLNLDGIDCRVVLGEPLCVCLLFQSCPEPHCCLISQMSGQCDGHKRQFNSCNYLAIWLLLCLFLSYSSAVNLTLKLSRTSTKYCNRKSTLKYHYCVGLFINALIKIDNGLIVCIYIHTYI